MAANSAELSQIVDGLSGDVKMISPKYFYDERGSQLFDEITRLPEYYLTGTELAIMRDNIDEIRTLVGEQASLIEFGSGSSLKTRVLLEHLSELAAYVPVDISREHLYASAAQIRDEFPHIDVRLWSQTSRSIFNCRARPSCQCETSCTFLAQRLATSNTMPR